MTWKELVNAINASAEAPEQMDQEAFVCGEETAQLLRVVGFDKTPAGVPVIRIIKG